MNRRKFLIGTGAAAATVLAPGRMLANGNVTLPAHLSINRGFAGPRIPRDFLGLSYESAQLATPEFFSTQNTDYAGFVKALGASGVLRIGGNTSGYSFWNPRAQKGTDAGLTPMAVGPDDASKPLPDTQTRPEAIRNLRDFLDMVGWRCIYGLNFARGTSDQAAEEAAAVSAILGDRLVAFQFGNEVDNFGKKGLRPAGYDYATFAREWEGFYRAVSARVPNLKVAGPDSAQNGAWIEEFAHQFGTRLVMLTSHYYAEGPPASPDATIDNLLNSCNPRWDDGAPKIAQAMAESHLPYRLTETNSCFHGGKAGVSNTFASSLWALDLMFELISMGGGGINFHGGGYGIYAPVVGSRQSGFAARPEYYSLLLFSQLVGGRMVSCQLQGPNPAPGISPMLVSYALQNSAGRLQSVVINKSRDTAFDLTMDSGGPAGRVLVQRLLAPSLESQVGVTFAGAFVGADGVWRADRQEYIAMANGTARVSIPAASAALLSWES